MTKALRIGLLALALAACQGSQEPPPIVGAWVVTMPGAPFPMHMFAFHADGTVQQSNPDAGDTHASDSNLIGAWTRDGQAYRGRLVEVTADRSTGRYAGRVEISFTATVTGDALEGHATASFVDAAGKRSGTPLEVRMTGERVLP